MSDYNATVEDIRIIDGVSVDISVSGDERKAEKVMMDLKEQCGRIAMAYEAEEPPRELSEVDGSKLPLMTVDWGSVFSEGDE